MASYRFSPTRLQQLLDRLDVAGSREAVEQMLEYPNDVFRAVLELVLTERLSLSSLVSLPDAHTLRAIGAQVRQAEEGSVAELIENAQHLLVDKAPPEIYYTRNVGHEVSIDGAVRLADDHPTRTRLSRIMERSPSGPLEEMLGRVYGIHPGKVSQSYPGLHRREESTQ